MRLGGPDQKKWEFLVLGGDERGMKQIRGGKRIKEEAKRRNPTFRWLIRGEGLRTQRGQFRVPHIVENREWERNRVAFVRLEEIAREREGNRGFEAWEEKESHEEERGFRELSFVRLVGIT